MYSERYFTGRDVDKTEWLDIFWALKAVGVRKNELIYDVGAGDGALARWLREKGYNVRACDPYSYQFYYGVEKCSLPDVVPPADVYILQHVLEHIAQWREALNSLVRAKAIIMVLPAHFVDDATHVYNHFNWSLSGEYRGLWGSARVLSIFDVVQHLSNLGYGVWYYPDLRSLLMPWDADYVVIASRRRRPGRIPTRAAWRITTMITKTVARMFA